MQTEGGLCGREVLRATVCCTNVYRLPVVPRMMGCLHSEQRGMRRVFTLVSVSLVPLTVSSLPPSTELGLFVFLGEKAHLALIQCPPPKDLCLQPQVGFC